MAYTAVRDERRGGRKEKEKKSGAGGGRGWPSLNYFRAN